MPYFRLGHLPLFIQTMHVHTTQRWPLLAMLVALSTFRRTYKGRLATLQPELLQWARYSNSGGFYVWKILATLVCADEGWWTPNDHDLCLLVQSGIV
jgi:hypothetical protein